MGRRLLASVVVAVSLVAAGCGGPSAQEKQQAKEKAARITAAKKRAAELRAAKVKADACEALFDPLLTELEDLDSRLGIGLTISKYADRVGDVKAAYDNVGWRDTKDIDCLRRVGLPAEKALNQYARAYTKWQNCVEDFDCSTDSIDSSLKRRWSKASEYVTDARTSLADMANPS